MKKIAIISIIYGWLPIEPGPSRFYYIANKFVEFGWDVELIGGSFQHYKKEYRDKEAIKNQNYPFKITLIDMPPYRKNIDFRRIVSHCVVAENLMKYLKDKHYDAVYCAIPPNIVASKVAKFCHKQKIPFIVDIEDLWPEAMGMLFKNHALVEKMLFPLKRYAETAYRYADAAIGTSEDYTDRSTLYSNNKLYKKTVYVGCDLKIFDNGVRQHRDEISKPENEIWVTYTGNIGSSYDIETLIRAAASLEKDGYSYIKIKLLGTGSLKESLEKLTLDLACKNVEFLGFVEYSKMAAFLSKSDIVINSFRKGAPQSIVNKIGDYLAAGKPMINTLENPVFTNIVKQNGIGLNIEAEDVDAMKNAILTLSENTELCKHMGDAARKLAETKFDRNFSYNEIVECVEAVTSNGEIE